ncbi:MAG TPA: ABC transporter ATP-binding protein [Acidimicrobiia bacterium]|jgi:branched-chain amino acid transport system ATP-binding protein
MTALLATRALDAGYGDLVVARGVNIELASGRVLALLGPNGAGKTTVLNTIAGLLPRASGEVIVDGVALPNGRAATANRAGVVLVPDNRALFTRLTVAENLRAAAPKSSSYDDVVDLFPALRRRWKLHAGALSGGEQQMLAMARALVQRPRVLLVDEMSMGLAPVIVEELLPVVRSVADETGSVVVLVEQHVHLALEVADEAMVLVHGEVQLHGDAAGIAADAAKLEGAYLGAPAS